MSRLLHAARRVMTALAILKLHLLARMRLARLEVDAHPTARIGLGVRLDIARGSRCVVSLGPDARIESDALVRLGGEATIHLGPASTIRSRAIVNARGRVVLHGRNLISWGSVLHCAESIEFEEMAGTGEMVTVVDSAHFRRHEDDHWYHNSSCQPVVVGRNAWLASKSTVTKGVRVGRGGTLGANSVLSEDLPDGALAVGVPARVVRRTSDDPVVGDADRR